MSVWRARFGVAAYPVYLNCRRELDDFQETKIGQVDEEENGIRAVGDHLKVGEVSSKAEQDASD